MNKQELIGAVADASGLSKGDASKAVEAVFDSITGALKKGDEVRLVGFGTFQVSNALVAAGLAIVTGSPVAEALAALEGGADLLRPRHVLTVPAHGLDDLVVFIE